MSQFNVASLSQNITTELFPLLLKNQTATIEQGKDGLWHAKKVNWFSRLIHIKDSKYHNERNGRIAAVLAKQLFEQPRLPMDAVEKNPKADVARRFLRELRGQKNPDPRIKECRKEYLAIKLSLESTVLDANPGFQEYAQECFLERYLLGYGHSLKINPQDNKIEILIDGSYKPWSEAYLQFKAMPPPQEGPRQPWLYGPKGVQKLDMYDWKELKPFKQGNPADWGNQYVFEFCICCSTTPRFTGDHSWIRLKTPTGDIYSVGLYRPGKPDWTHNFRQPFRVKEGLLMQPDVSEFWPCDLYTIPVAITEEQFLKMKHTIEKDKQDNDQVFQLFQKNCMLYCHKIAALGDIRLPTTEIALRMITPLKTQQKAEEVMNKSPLLKKIFIHTQAFFINLTQVLLGASKVDAKVSAKHPGQKIKPHIQSIFDIFKISKSELNHPFTLGQKTRKRIMNWRQEETSKLKSEQAKLASKITPQTPQVEVVKYQQEINFLENKINKVRFDLPANFRLA